MDKKKWVSLAALLAAIAVLGGVLVALTALNKAEETEDAGIPLWQVGADDITVISYESSDATAALTKGADGVWTLDSDALLPIDQDKAQTIAESLANMAAQRALDDTAEVDAMGFDAPQMSFAFTVGGAQYTLTVGDQNTMTAAYYAQTSVDDTVYTIATSDLTTVCKTPEELYAAQDVATMESADATTMTLQSGGETLAFANDGESWTLADDADYSLDQDIVTRMASTICDLTTSWSITAPEGDAAYGFDAPAAVVTLGDSSGNTITCTFGDTTADGASTYLKTDAAPGVVYEIAAGQMTAFAYTKATLKAATPETAETGTDSSDVVAEAPVGGINDYASSLPASGTAE